MSLLIKYIGGSSAVEDFSLYGNTFIELPLVGVDTTFSDVVIQSDDTAGDGAALPPGDSRTVQMLVGEQATGTITSTDVAVVGSGTAFTTALAPGSYIKAATPATGVTTRQVLSIADDTHLTLVSAPAEDWAAAPYVAISLRGDPVTLAGPDSQQIGSFGDVLVPADPDGDAISLVFFRVSRVFTDKFDQRMTVNCETASPASQYGVNISDLLSWSTTPPAFSLYYSLDPAVISGALAAADVQGIWPSAGKFTTLAVRLTDTAGFVTDTEHIEVYLQVNGVDTLLRFTDATLDAGEDKVLRAEMDVAVIPGDLINIRAHVISGGDSEEEVFRGTLVVVFEPN